MNEPSKLPKVEKSRIVDDYATVNPYDTVPNPAGRNQAVPSALQQPERIGRYRVEKTLGEGGFGRVYQAHDEELKRRVAIKVPHPERISQPEDVEQYLTEAQVLASLDHPAVERSMLDVPAGANSAVVPRR